MISDQLSPTPTAPTDRRDHALRLQMKPAGAARGHVAGGWWPWSDDPAAEFPALITALRAWVGPVNRVSYHLGTWGPVARKAPVGGRMVRFEGFHSIDPHNVVVIGADYRRVSLLVVPPGIPAGAARAALRSAADRDSTANIADILASNGVPLDAHHFSPVFIPSAHPAEPTDRRPADHRRVVVKVQD
ncbi:DUF5994 family protein [Lentzea sp. BCCO 10_0856]|uniref:DUF5994 family protein n=1 Tax=Lentzea miocenica TaxID=3095431 RepID=A0ABU4T1N8_9PSEU|nr:DUF5994 family protein [Lentzea sp. BCCO 10_0856]MDX8032075.1 DUF5994 family protein [Lentzea sp. BCCO 10_0856]